MARMFDRGHGEGMDEAFGKREVMMERRYDIFRDSRSVQLFSLSLSVEISNGYDTLHDAVA